MKNNNPIMVRVNDEALRRIDAEVKSKGKSRAEIVRGYVEHCTGMETLEEVSGNENHQR